jgi:hypothetical protein
MPRKIVRASEYWNEDAPRPTRVSGHDWQALAQGPSIQPGLLHFGAATAPDPSKAPGQDDADEEGAEVMKRLRKMPGLTDFNRALSGGGAHGDGTPENWPGILPGDQLMGDADQALGGIINKLPGLLGKGK